MNDFSAETGLSAELRRQVDSAWGTWMDQSGIEDGAARAIIRDLMTEQRQGQPFPWLPPGWAYVPHNEAEPIQYLGEGYEDLAAYPDTDAVRALATDRVSELLGTIRNWMSIERSEVVEERVVRQMVLDQVVPEIDYYADVLRDRVDVVEGDFQVQIEQMLPERTRDGSPQIVVLLRHAGHRPVGNAIGRAILYVVDSDPRRGHETLHSGTPGRGALGNYAWHDEDLFDFLETYSFEAREQIVLRMLHLVDEQLAQDGPLRWTLLRAIHPDWQR